MSNYEVRLMKRALSASLLELSIKCNGQVQAKTNSSSETADQAVPDQVGTLSQVGTEKISK